MRAATALCLALGLTAAGCGRSGPAAPAPPEEAAARAFGVAEALEKEHRTRKAFAAYDQVARLFPATPHGKMAAERLRTARRAALLRKPG